MTSILIYEIAQAELAKRSELASEIMSIVLSRYSTDGYGFVRRGEVQQYVYQSLGFHGRGGNNFARFMNKIMAENGFRKSFYSGQRVYCGLKPVP